MMSVRLAVGAIVTHNSGILLVHKVRASDGFGGPKKIQGEWDFPKGGVKDGETILEALARELYEETGITDYEIVSELPVLRFKFSSAVQKYLGYSEQETRMFLLKIPEDLSKLGPRCDEIESLDFVGTQELKNKLTHESCRRYYSRLQMGSLMREGMLGN